MALCFADLIYENFASICIFFISSGKFIINMGNGSAAVVSGMECESNRNIRPNENPHKMMHTLPILSLPLSRSFCLWCALLWTRFSLTFDFFGNFLLEMKQSLLVIHTFVRAYSLCFFWVYTIQNAIPNISFIDNNWLQKKTNLYIQANLFAFEKLFSLVVAMHLNA